MAGTSLSRKVSTLPESEKLTLNLGFVDLGNIDLLVKEGFYSNRSDFMRSAIRQQLLVHGDTLRETVARKRFKLGLQHFTRDDLESVLQAGEMLEIRAIGLASIASDVSAELARATISSISVLGALNASSDVKAALADRMR